MEFFRQEHWSGLPFPSPKDRPNPRIKPTSLVSPALIGGFFTSSAMGGGSLFHSTNTWKSSIHLDIFHNIYHMYIKKEKERREQNVSKMQIHPCQAKFKGLQYLFVAPKIRFILLKKVSESIIMWCHVQLPSALPQSSHGGNFQSLERRALSWPWTFLSLLSST